MLPVVEEDDVSAAVGQVVDGEVEIEKKGVSDYDKDNIDSLIRLLREKDALIAEKDALLSQANKLHPPHHGMLAPIKDTDGSEGEDDEHTPHGLELELAGSIRNGAATFDDYLNAQKRLKLKSYQSQKWKNSTLSMMTYDENDGIHASTTTVRTAEEMRVIQTIFGRRGTAAWDEDNHLVQLDEDGPEDRRNTPWYLPPIQRQRWCEDQILPHVNWGDLFFDLFYVGAAFNLGVLVLTAGQSIGQELLRGFLYFFGSLGPLWTCWEVQTFYQSRYLTNDYFHRAVEILRYLCVGTGIYNITPIGHYSDPDSDNVVVFTGAMLFELMLSMGLGLELYFKGIGDKSSIKNHTLDDFKFRNGGLFVLYLAAFIIAAVQYAHAQVQEGGFFVAVNAAGEKVNEGDLYYPSEADHSATTDDNETSHGAEHRVLGSSSPQEAHSLDRHIWDIHDLPMALTAAAYFLRFVLSSVRYHYRERKGDVREWYVPANIDYLIHRYGEFVMLMIGEGILSLLIIETVETKEYYVVVACGMLTMIFIYVLKTESEPSDSSKHALWRSQFGVMSYSLFMYTLTIGLIGFGVSYKAFLHDIYDEVVENIVHTYFTDRGFCGFLTAVILSLELMNASHRGLLNSISYLFRADDEGKKKLNWPVAIVALLKVGIVLFCVTIFTWTNDPDTLTVSGLLVVVALSITRVLNHIFINETEMVQST
mmetsp:Transcript_37558/g.76808  ORF Transcript_37558/g.76808 Transcript_37558/m.76808 type:complete len:705 (-) Transcript_37558:1077-3191(-)